MQVPLTNSDRFVLVDSVDYVRVSRFSWHLNSGYVRRALPARGGQQRWQFLHVFLMGSRPGVLVDHKDADTLNHRRDNLRWATRRQNAQNRQKRAGCSSPFKGVYWYGPTNKWKAQICVFGRVMALGYFVIAEDAARAYDAAAIKHFGDFARPNFLKTTV